MGALRRSGVLFCVGAMLLIAIAPALAGPSDHVRDEFNAVSYTGSDGTVAWDGPWLEAPLTNGPEAGLIRVVSDSHCFETYCLRFGSGNVTGRGAYRNVDLREATSARLTFSSRRDVEATGGQMAVMVSTDGWSWTSLASYPLDASDAGNVPRSIDLSAWAGLRLKIGFFGTGEFNGYFFIDNVDIALSANASPVFGSSLPPRSDSEGTTVKITPEVSDPDSSSLTFTATGLPSGVQIDTGTGVISGTIGFSAAAASPYTTTVTASDGGGAASSSFIWSVTNVNRPPTLAAIADRTSAELTSMSITVHADDPDLPGDSLRFLLASAPPGTAISQTGVVTWTPNEASGPGTHTIWVRVEDAATPAAAVVRSFHVVVTEVNAPPELSYIADQSLAPGDQVSLTVVATDPDIPANTVSFSASGLPPGVTINGSTGRIAGVVPGDTPPSSGTAIVTAKDNGVPPAQSVRTFSWQITDGNRAPILEPIPDQEPDSSGVVMFTAAAKDADRGDAVSFWLAAGIDPIPEGAAIDPSTGRFTWRPTDVQHDATYRINVGVSDSGSPRLSDTQLVTIVIPKLNNTPRVSSVADQKSAEGEAVSLTISASDPDDTDKLRFSATGLPSGLFMNSTTGVISGEIGFDAGADSPYTVRVTVSDDGHPVRSASTSFGWKVDDTNRPPTVSPTSLVVLVGEPAVVVLDAVDPDGDQLVFTLAEAPTLGILEGDFPNLEYTSVGGSSDQFTYSVSDGEFDVEGLVTIEIRSENSPPVAVLDEYSVPADTELSVALPGVLGNDADPDGELLTAALVARPDHGELTLNPDGSFLYDPEAGYIGGDKFTYAAVDGLGERSLATVVLTVGDQAAPVVTLPDGGSRTDVVTATATSWRPPVAEESSASTQMKRAVVASVNAGISSVPDLGYPLLLLAVTLLVAVTLGRVSLLPFAAGKTQEEGLVGSYNELYGFGTLVPDSEGDNVFVHGRALDSPETLAAGQRVEFIAATIKGRRIALKVWAAT